jgi:hypothetical protein
LMGFLVDSFLPVSCFAVEGSLENAQPVTASKSVERTTAVTMDIGPPLSNWLLETLGFELGQGIVFDGVADFEGVAADLTVFDVAVMVNREVQDHRDLFAAKGAGEGVFHDTYATANFCRITNGAGRRH